MTAVTRLHHEEPKQPSRLFLPPQTQPDELALLAMTLSPLQHHWARSPTCQHLARGRPPAPAFLVTGIAVALTCSADTIAFFENWEKKKVNRGNCLESCRNSQSCGTALWPQPSGLHQASSTEKGPKQALPQSVSWDPEMLSG